MTNSLFYSLCTFGMVSLANYAYLTYRCGIKNGTQLPLLYSDISKLKLLTASLLSSSLVILFF